MKKRSPTWAIINIPLLLLIPALMIPHAASARTLSARERLRAYMVSDFYQKKLFETATKSVMKNFTCGEPNPRLVRERMHVLSDISFEGKKINPVQGMWVEKTHVILCGTVRDVDVTVVARPNYAPVFIAK